MEDFVLKTPIAIRFKQDELEEINKSLPDFVVDIDGEVNTHSVFMSIWKRAISATNNRKQAQRVEELEKELEEYKALQIENGRNADSLIEKINEISAENEKLKEEKQQLENVLSEMDSRLELLGNDLNDKGRNLRYFNDPETIVIRLSEQQLIVTTAFLMALREDSRKSEIEISEMLFDLFWKYIREQKTQIAFPFYFSNTEIKLMLQGKITLDELKELNTLRDIRKELRK